MAEPIEPTTPTYKVNIMFDSKEIEISINGDMKLSIEKFEPSLNIDENNRLNTLIMQVAYLLRNNGGTRFEVVEMTE